MVTCFMTDIFEEKYGIFIHKAGKSYEFLLKDLFSARYVAKKYLKQTLNNIIPFNGVYFL